MPKRPPSPTPPRAPLSDAELHEVADTLCTIVFDDSISGQDAIKIFMSCLSWVLAASPNNEYEGIRDSALDGVRFMADAEHKRVVMLMASGKRPQ